MIDGKILRVWDKGVYPKYNKQCSQLQVIDEREQCFVLCLANPKIFRIGDYVWWQNDELLWTAPNGDQVKFKKISNSSQKPYQPIGTVVNETQEAPE